MIPAELIACLQPQPLVLREREVDDFVKIEEGPGSQGVPLVVQVEQVQRGEQVG
jgi:hypothetical protein